MGDIYISSPLPQSTSGKQCAQIKRKKTLEVVPALLLPCKPFQQDGWDCARREREARWSERPGWARDSLHSTLLKAEFGSKRWCLKLPLAPATQTIAELPLQLWAKGRGKLIAQASPCTGCIADAAPDSPGSHTCTALAHPWHPSLILLPTAAPGTRVPMRPARYVSSPQGLVPAMPCSAQASVGSLL